MIHSRDLIETILLHTCKYIYFTYSCIFNTSSAADIFLVVHVDCLLKNKRIADTGFNAKYPDMSGVYNSQNRVLFSFAVKCQTSLFSFF